ncbi:MAG: nucleoside deaminase [Alphaproteobacteria bacterium]
MTDDNYIKAALEEARKAAIRDEVPIGAVLVHRASGEIAAADGNRTLELNDPTAHAEILVIREICRKTGAQRIPEYDLYVTLEPCAMCAAAISFARLGRVVFGALDPKGGGVLHGGQFYTQPTCHHRPEAQHFDMPDCGQILRDYFKGKR